jgi:predicted ferric reductase
MTHLLWGGLWIAAYLVLVLAPLFVLLVGKTPPPGGLWWDFGIALGFAGAAMMAVQFVLTARFKRATLPYGIDVVYYFHRYLAVVAFLVILAHPVLLVATNPAVLFLANPMTAPWHMTAGLVSVIGFSALLATSLLRCQLGLEYDAWRRLHALLAVGSLGLALAHIDGVGYFVASPGKRLVWDAIGALVIALMAYVRVVRPWRLVRTPYRVVSVTPERADAWTVAVEPVGHHGLRFEAGQFAWLTLRHSPFAMREHPFSISSCPSASGRLEFTIKELGDFTRTVRDVRAGERAYVDGPYGAFTVDRYDAPGYCFIGGGIGLAPIMSMLRALAERGDRRPLVLITGNSQWERVTFREPIAELAARLTLRVVHVLESPPSDWTGEVGRIDAALLDRHLPANRRDLEYFVCGPTPMIEAVEHALRALGIPSRRCHSELFDLV